MSTRPLTSLFSGTGKNIEKPDEIITDLLKYCNKREKFDNFTNEEKQDVYTLIDAFCEVMRSKLNRKYRGDWANFCKDFRHFCQGEKTCTALPGYTKEKAFIAHITHTLQDWGLFGDYLNIPGSRRNEIFRLIKDPPKRESRVYTDYIGKEIGILAVFLERKFKSDTENINNEISKIIERKDNVVFLRQFDTDCCKIKGDFAPSGGERKERNDNHDDFIEDLETVVKALTAGFNASVFQKVGRQRKEKRKREDPSFSTAPSSSTRQRKTSSSTTSTSTRRKKKKTATKKSSTVRKTSKT